MSKKIKAVFLDSETVDKGDIDWKILEDKLDLKLYPVSSGDEVVVRSENAGIIICNKTKITASHIKALPKLKYIIVAATGYDNIDLKEAAQHNIAVSNIRGYSTSSVSQHVFALLLAFLNRSETYFELNKNGAWSKQELFSYWNHSIEELHGKKFGIIGLGTIGKAVAKIAIAFGMKVIAFHKHPERDKMSGVTFVDFDTLLKDSEVMSLHIPLNDQTSKIINADSLNKMSSDCILINTARGGLIDETHLRKALEKGQIRAALLDVLNEEPPELGHVLQNVKNCYITPHQAWASKQSRERLIFGIRRCVDAYLKGSIENQVN